MKKLIVVSVLCLLNIPIMVAQQEPLLGQYMFNPLVYNPAYTGSHEAVSISASFRKQWAGIEGAPSTSYFGIHSPLYNLKERRSSYLGGTFDENVAFGLIVFQDEIGITKQSGFYGSAAYKIPFLNAGTLSFGLQMGLKTYEALYSSLELNDPAFQNHDIHRLIPNFGTGVYYSADRFFIGLSVPQMLNTSIENDESQTALIRNYYFTSGYVFKLSHALKYKPTILIKKTLGAPYQIDVTSNLLIHDIVWIGAGWRSMSTFNGLIQISILPNLQLGYSHDFSAIDDFSEIAGATHEISLNYRFSLLPQRINHVKPVYF